MAIRVQFAKGAKRGWGSLLLRIGLAFVGIVAIVVCVVFGYFYFRYQGIVDERLKQPLFETTAKIYATPKEIRPGQKLTVSAIANELRQAGYTTDGATKSSPLGTYSESGSSIAVHPGPQSFHSQDG